MHVSIRRTALSVLNPHLGGLQILRVGMIVITQREVTELVEPTDQRHTLRPLGTAHALHPTDIETLAAYTLPYLGKDGLETRGIRPWKEFLGIDLTVDVRMMVPVRCPVPHSTTLLYAGEVQITIPTEVIDHPWFQYHPTMTRGDDQPTVLPLARRFAYTVTELPQIVLEHRHTEAQEFVTPHPRRQCEDYDHPHRRVRTGFEKEGTDLLWSDAVVLVIIVIP